MDVSVRTGMNHINFGSRRADESALRRYQAVQWLDSLVGPLGVSSQPSESEFISCLRNGQILCNAINKIQPGTVPKVVETNLLSVNQETQPLHAYQYFENVRNFLLALEDLKLPAFEASDLERDALTPGSGAKIVDCILSLKNYHEWKQTSNGNGLYKHMRSPMVMQSASRMQARASGVANPTSSCRKLELPKSSEKPSLPVDTGRIEDTIAKLLADSMVGAKENIDDNLLASFSNGSMDPVKLLGKIISTCYGEEPQSKCSELNTVLQDYVATKSRSSTHSTSSPLQDLSSVTSKGCKNCSRKGSCNHKQRFQMQEKELLVIKNLLSNTRKEFEDLQAQVDRDLKELGTQVQEMSAAALGYQKVVKENRILYNMVQDLKGNIRVYLRIKPIFSEKTRSVVDFMGDDGSVVIADPSKPQRDGRKAFKFNKVFGPSASQADVFLDTQPLIRSVMDGYNVCIFAYGQTGSGKTHTMSGPSGGQTKDLGINYLALNDLFELSSTRKGVVDYEIHVQMVEIYNEQVRDLLSENASTTKLEIRSCTTDGSLTLPDAAMRQVKSTDDVIKLMKLGELNRFVSSTALNYRSSRSHSILTVHVIGRDVSGCNIRSCLHLVDLAGSERVDKSEVTGERLKEAQYINKSLSCLGDVITALAQKNSHIPYRNSKLTLLLQDSLGGNAKTLMFAHVNPEDDSFGETISTLKFAQRASTVELGLARANKESSEVLQLKEQVDNLKKALANKEKQGAQQEPAFSLLERPKPMLDRTPPRPRRLSIESSSMKTVMMKTPTRSSTRRLSIEGGPKSIKDGDTVSRSYGYLNHTPKSPTPPSSLHCPKSPEPPGINEVPSLARQREPTSLSGINEVPSLARQIEPPTSLSQTPEVLSSVLMSSSKGSSHIRKSLRTIGKFIGSEKRQKKSSVVEARSPTRGGPGLMVGAAATGDVRGMRRQSLTGIPTPGTRRSSLGGNKQVELKDSERRNAKTPPPTHPQSVTQAPGNRRTSIGGKQVESSNSNEDRRNAKTPPPSRWV